MSSNKHGSLAVVTDYRLVSHTPLVPSQNPTITIAFQCRITRHLAPLCFSCWKSCCFQRVRDPASPSWLKHSCASDCTPHLRLPFRCIFPGGDKDAACPCPSACGPGCTTTWRGCHMACVLPCTPQPVELEMNLPLDRHFSSMAWVYQEGFVNLAGVWAYKAAFEAA